VRIVSILIPPGLRTGAALIGTVTIAPYSTDTDITVAFPAIVACDREVCPAARPGARSYLAGRHMVVTPVWVFGGAVAFSHVRQPTGLCTSLGHALETLVPGLPCERGFPNGASYPVGVAQGLADNRPLRPGRADG
jgi:hypothetical protein